MAETNNILQAEEAVNLFDTVDTALRKAKAIVWLMTHQDTSEVVSKDALDWAGVIVDEFIDTAAAAVEANCDQVRARARANAEQGAAA